MLHYADINAFPSPVVLQEAVVAPPHDTPGTSSSTPWLVVVALAIGITLARCAVPLIWTHQFDADEAIFGLMAKHLIEGRAFPLFMYGSPYMLGVEAWAAAPLFLLAGPSVVALRLPLLLVNAATAWLLVRILHKDAGLTPAAAFGASLPFVLAPPFLSTGAYMSASGGNIEPCLYVLLLWTLRRRPWWFGLVLALAFLHRQFSAYGAVALLCIQAMDRSLLRKATFERWLIVLLTFTASWETIDLVRVWSSPLGPGTSFASEGRGLFEQAARFACVAPSTMVGGVRTFVTEVVPLMTGLESHRPLGVVLGCALILGAIRVLWLLVTMPETRPVVSQLAPCVYIALTGLFSAMGYVALRCGVVNVETLRYSLITPLFFVGAGATFFLVESSRTGRRLATLALCAWSVVPVTQFGSLVGGHLREPPTSALAELASHLESRGITNPTGDYWDAYAVTFLSNERVHVASDGVVRIMQYEWEFDRQVDRLRISRAPCTAGGHEAVPGRYWLCRLEP